MPKPKILVVDDEPDLVRAMQLRLRANNYEVTTAQRRLRRNRVGTEGTSSADYSGLRPPRRGRFRGSGSLQNERYAFRLPSNRAEPRPSG
jgi:hypothetical protein